MRNPLKRLFKANRHPPVKPHCPPGSRIYCIGDIHGRYDLLKQLHEKILLHAENYSGHKELIYLGDYIDRGEHSNRVIECLLGEPMPGFDIVYLRGNHEQTMLDFLDDPEIGRSWFNFGGLQTLVSYGVRYKKLPTGKKDLQALRDDLQARVPYSHVIFLENTRYAHSSGSYYFVHAGIKPHLALEHQQPVDQLWIRDEFIEHTRPYEKIIVHGHTVSDEVEFMGNRIGLDTGAYLSGKLSCLVLEDDRQQLIQTHA
jgi:serine/threonine protein phosphatase 1